MKRSPLVLSVAIALPVAVLVLAGARVFAPLEDQLTSLRYRVRGVEPADTNIVLVYIDNEAVKTVGWPVRRNFDALLLHALADLHPRAIGMEIVFEDPRAGYEEFPEYDTLLAATMRQTGCTVLASYFDRLGDGTDSALAMPPAAGYPRIHGDLLNGRGLHLPLPAFAAAAAGIGHVNFGDDDGTTIPALVNDQGTAVPAFALEILRVASGTARNDVLLRDGLVLLDREGHERRIPLSGRALARLDFPGPLRSFVHYPLLDVLRAYDELRHGRHGPVPVERLKDKIVLVGVIAEGRSEFRTTPFDSRTPTLVHHATFIHDALHQRFLTKIAAFPVALLLLIAVFGCTGAVLLLPRPLNVIAPFSALALLVVISFALFVLAALLLPVAAIVTGSIIATLIGLMIRWRAEGKRVDLLTAEKEEIMTRLRDREAKVALLEREILDLQNEPAKDRTGDLMEEVRRYKAEIYALSTRAQDMERFVPAQDEEQETPETFEGIVYAPSGAMKPVIEFVRKIAASDAPVLILGESGTGKELVARAIHTRSARAAKPFIAVNCGALAENLLESELFGHEKGAFTGAVKDRLGRFELADGGTIFLDEIGEVSPAFQLKLLRVLQEGEFERVGGTKTLHVSVRIVAATNKDLRQEVARGAFREDLYYRLNVLTLSLPPLRARPADIPVLLDHFLQREGGGVAVSKGVMEILQAHAWPGNVRELESTVRRSVLMARADNRPMIVARDLPDELAAALHGMVPVHDQVLELVRAKGFSRSAVSDTAAELGGLNRGTVAEYLRGECLRIFYESAYNSDDAARRIALSADEPVLERVHKRLNEYLVNIAAAVDQAQPWESSRAALRPKIKNLPQRYHPFVEQLAEAFYRGIWHIEE